MSRPDLSPGRTLRTRIRKLGVVGAGTMGNGIAALAASAGVPVVLLDIPGPEGDRNAPAKGGLDRARKSKPAAFMDPDRAQLVRIGNTEDDLELLSDCDLVIEAIIEQLEPKRALYERLEKVLPPTAIVASNTSGIPMHMLVEGRSERFAQRFVGMHFFNPPRYLHLLEIIPTGLTSSDVLAEVRRFSERTFGKGIVVAKDVPGFVANRLGVYGMVLAMRLMEQYDLTIDETDFLLGTLTGRAKSAVFRTADLSGVDVIWHVTRGLAQTTGEDFALPAWVNTLVETKRLGEKTGAGFYKKVGKEIQVLDWKNDTYAASRKPEAPELEKLQRKPLAERLAAVKSMEGKYGDFTREMLLRFSHYVLERADEIAYDLASVDQAMEWGYAWEAGPVKQVDLLGVEFVREGFAKLGLSEPRLLSQVHAAVSQGAAAGSAPSGQLKLDDLRKRGAVIEETKDAAILDLGSDVLLLEFRSKMNSLGEGVITMLHRALEQVASGGYAGLVIGNDDPRTFTAGADLFQVAAVVQAGEWKKLDAAIKAFQDTSMALRAAPFPVVIAPFGLTLGGGCEFTLHADRVQSHAELYCGLVEVGVGLIPGGGGTKELLFRFTQELAPYDEADPFEGVKRAFKLIAMAATSTSALEARKMGFLREGDRISMNRDLLIGDAKQRVLDLAPDYVTPQPRTIVALGREGVGNLDYAAWAMKEGGYASAHDVKLAHEVAYVLCGGDGPSRVVTEQDILDLERDAFLRLLGTRETQERIAFTLKTGKPLRN
ncbi:MAG: enoyl-CoA hydratase/3,2-trans-enoyl-CoA isomerase/3-hydroxyacyl-CoA dehydrogenase [Gemmatimonadetes bacterium]|nr:enoyl-CoA hydratase/3,2-trans-enoyl-CoA isomerase/3-hydroxyacyl-CoA dehydrogenase [Gemmatimonadota bacterium]